jgi:hypothetical protein
MQPPFLKTYRPGMPLAGNVFYILNKGLNSGKPLSQPCPNCFAAMCRTESEKDFWIGVCELLLVSRRFERELIGSVIPFIRIGDLKSQLRPFCDLDQQFVLHSIEQVNRILELEMSLQYQLTKIKQVKMALANNALRLL